MHPPSKGEITRVYGIWVDGHWWERPDGEIYHTLFKKVAEIQAHALLGRGAKTVEVRPIQ